MTSYDVVRRVKRLLPRGHKIGHGGTLDPFAEGVLLLLLGKATRRFEEIRGWRKTYLATARLGARSDTLDKDGKIKNTLTREQNNLTIERMQEIANKYLGESEQVVPLYAAAKHEGRKLYEYAREGKEVPQKKKAIVIERIEVVAVTPREMEMRVVCGGGTYIRQLSYDILKEQDVESYLETLVRERIGEIGTDDCFTLDKLVDEGTVARCLWLGRGE